MLSELGLISIVVPSLPVAEFVSHEAVSNKSMTTTAG
jgi:hypothetical protein